MNNNPNNFTPGKLNKFNRGYVYLPSEYDGSTLLPRIDFYHGSGEMGNPGQESKMLGQGLPKVISDRIINNTIIGSDLDKFIIIFVQSEDSVKRSPSSSETITFWLSTGLICDINRMYATGLSAGGDRCLEAIKGLYMYYAAFIPMSAATYLSDYSKYSADNVSEVRAFCGATDNTGTPDVLTRMIDTVNNLNSWKPKSAELIIYDGGHSNWINIYNPDWRWTSHVLAKKSWEKDAHNYDTNEPDGLSIYEWFLKHDKGEIKEVPSSDSALTFNANTRVPEYKTGFLYGSNMGYYGEHRTDLSIAKLIADAGVHTIRPTLPDEFVAKYGINIRKAEFEAYTSELGMQDLTLFVEKPRPEWIKPGTKVWQNLYEPIWVDGQVNPDNYFGQYIKLLVDNYGQYIKFWEIVNEPDITGFWDNGNKTRSDNWWINPPSPDQLINLKVDIFSYIRMLRIAYEVIKDAFPNSYVTPGGLGYPAFLDALLRYTDNPDNGNVTEQYPLTGGAYFDVLDYHIYPAYGLKEWDNGGFNYYRHSDRAADVVISTKKDFEDVLTGRGYDGKTYPQKHFICTETNLPRKDFSKYDEKGEPSIKDYYGGKEIQRNFIIKTLVQFQKNGVRQFYIYGPAEAAELDTATDEYTLMGLYENLKRPIGEEKLNSEGIAWQTTSSFLFGREYDSARTKELNLPDVVDGGAFSKNGKYRYVLWARTNTDRSENASAVIDFGFDVMKMDWIGNIDPLPSQKITLSGTPSFLFPADEDANIPEQPESNEENNEETKNAFPIRITAQMSDGTEKELYNALK